MNKFGAVKSKVLSKLTEAYASGDKKTVKEIINIIKENKDFKDLYLLYEDVENKYFADKETAESYVIELGRALNGKITTISETITKLDEVIGNVETSTPPTYDDLDSLLQEDNLLNIETKVRAKIDLFKHLTKKKSIAESSKTTFTANEKLLYSVLANNFNVLHENILSDNDKNEFRKLMELTENELQSKTNELKESIVSKINQLMNESSDSELKSKLETVKEEVTNTSSSRYNYFKLIELQNGL